MKIHLTEYAEQNYVMRTQYRRRQVIAGLKEDPRAVKEFGAWWIDTEKAKPKLSPAAQAALDKLNNAR